MCLRFLFLLTLRVPTRLRLSRRSSTWKDAEILLLRHEVTLLERRSTTRPKPTWADRALFAALLAVIPRARHAELHLPVMPATILRRHRDLIKRHWAAKSQPKSPGRPRRHPTITRLVLRMARDNEHWGYRRITGELASLGITVAPSTVWEILKKHGINPAPWTSPSSPFSAATCTDSNIRRPSRPGLSPWFALHPLVGHSWPAPIPPARVVGRQGGRTCRHLQAGKPPSTVEER
jgi:transposase